MPRNKRSWRWVSRDTLPLSLVTIWKGRSKPTFDRNWWDGPRDNEACAVMQPDEFELVFGFLPRLGACHKLELTTTFLEVSNASLRS